MSGLRSRRKGLGFEQELVRALQEAGIAAERIPLSGAAGGSFCGDLTIPVQGVDRRFECKRRAAGFSTLYRWLAGNYGLIVRDDRQEALVILRLTDFSELARTRGTDAHGTLLPQHKESER